MSTIDRPTLYDDLLDLLVHSADVEGLLSYRLSEAKQSRLNDLLDRNRGGMLTPDDRMELEEFERLEHLGRMVKARLRQLNAE